MRLTPREIIEVMLEAFLNRDGLVYKKRTDALWINWRDAHITLFMLGYAVDANHSGYKHNDYFKLTPEGYQQALKWVLEYKNVR